MELRDRERIAEILTGLVACPGISCTKDETIAENYVYDFLSKIPYLKKHPDQLGFLEIPDDPYGRKVPYAVILGKSRNTVIMSGHIDVVSVEVYGEAAPLAFTVGKELEDELSKMPLDDKARADLESGEWIWGRGTADMKGGIAIAMYLTEKYAELADRGELEGPVVFGAVADEESYSAGMRAFAPELVRLKKKYGLEYKLLVDPEPAAESGDAQVMSLGTVGKTLPVIISQGIAAHVGHCYDGISALNTLTHIFSETQGSLRFVDVYKDEASMPPSWQGFRDLKDNYDATLPFKAAGYMTVLSFDKTADDIIAMLKDIAVRAADEEVKRLNREYAEFKKLNHFETREKLDYQARVLTVRELVSKLTERDGETFKKAFAGIYDEAAKKIAEGTSFPDATVFLMNELLKYADIKQPVVLIGMAPPYYPPTHSDLIPGKEGFGTKVFEFARELSEREFGQKLVSENYFTGISDNSYTYLPDIDFSAVAANYPMWGKTYDLDLDAIRELSVPAVLYGPIGRDYHRWTERVSRHSLVDVMPVMIDEVIGFAWNS